MRLSASQIRHDLRTLYMTCRRCRKEYSMLFLFLDEPEDERPFIIREIKAHALCAECKKRAR